MPRRKPTDVSIRITGQPDYVDTVFQQIEGLFRDKIVRGNLSKRRDFSSSGEVSVYLTVSAEKKK